MIPPVDGVYFTSPGVATVTWEEAAQSVLVEWDGWANSSEFAALLEAEILTPKDQDRANREWLPRAMKAGLTRFAGVVPAGVVAAMNIRDSLGKASSSALQVEYFTTVEEARDWLAR